VNFVENAHGHFAYVTVGGRNEVQVYQRGDYALVATIPVGALPHGLWPSGDGTRLYVGLENGDGMVAIDTLTNKVIATIPIGQAPQAIAYIPNAVTQGSGTQGLQMLGVAGSVGHVLLGTPGSVVPLTTVSLFNQGLVQVLQAAVTGLAPLTPYVLAFSAQPDGGGPLEPLASFKTNPAGAAIVDASGPIRQIVNPQGNVSRRYLVITAGTPTALGVVTQIQSADAPAK
jgi:YVTN family beta-propeller protein